MAFLRFMFAVLLLIPAAAQAQEEPKIPYEDYPQELLDQSKLLYDECRNDPFQSRQYDCACRALKFLDLAILKPPGTPTSAVMMNLGNICPNEVNIAGAAFQQCSGMGTPIPEGKTVDEYCECFAKKYTKMVSNYGGVLTNKFIIYARTEATVACRRE